MLFQGANDLAYMKRINRELYKKFMMPTDVYLYDHNQKDPLYGESTDKTWNQATSKPSYTVEAYFPELTDWKAKLTKHGLDEKRPLKGYFFVDSFPELGVEPPRVGDRISIEGELYKVMQDNPKDYFFNTQIPLTHSVDLQRVRPESITVRPRQALESDLYPESTLKGDFQK
jgi:hypothetical protein